MLAAAVTELGWYPAAFTDDRVGGNPYGNEGFKSIAYELARDHGDELETVVDRLDAWVAATRGVG